MAIAAASPSQKAGQYAASASVALAFPNNVAAGSLLTIAGWTFTGTTNAPPTVASLTKTAGTATIGPIRMEVLNTRDIGPGAAIVHGVQYSAIVLTAGSLTFTLNGGAAGLSCYIALDEYTGRWDSGRLFAANGANGNGSAQSSGNASSTGPALFVGGLLQINATTGASAAEDGAFTLINEVDSTPTSIGGSAIARIVTGITTDSADWTTSAGTDWVATVAVYQERPPAPVLSSPGANDITDTSVRPKVTITY